MAITHIALQERGEPVNRITEAILKQAFPTLAWLGNFGAGVDRVPQSICITPLVVLENMQMHPIDAYTWPQMQAHENMISFTWSVAVHQHRVGRWPGILRAFAIINSLRQSRFN